MRSVFFAIVLLIICCSELSFQGVDCPISTSGFSSRLALTALEMGLEGILSTADEAVMFVQEAH